MSQPLDQYRSQVRVGAVLRFWVVLGLHVGGWAGSRVMNRLPTGEWSARLTANWRLIVRPEERDVITVIVIEIVDYH